MQRREELEFNDAVALSRSHIVNLRLDRVRDSSRAKVQDQPGGFVRRSLSDVGGRQDRDRRGTGCREQCCDEDERSRR
jgi:hypothetical protein